MVLSMIFTQIGSKIEKKWRYLGSTQEKNEQHKNVKISQKVLVQFSSNFATMILYLNSME